MLTLLQQPLHNISVAVRRRQHERCASLEVKHVDEALDRLTRVRPHLEQHGQLLVGCAHDHALGPVKGGSRDCRHRLEHAQAASLCGLVPYCVAAREAAPIDEGEVVLQSRVDVQL
jgi:hypothetical protein